MIEMFLAFLMSIALAVPGVGWNDDELDPETGIRVSAHELGDRLDRWDPDALDPPPACPSCSFAWGG